MFTHSFGFGTMNTTPKGQTRWKGIFNSRCKQDSKASFVSYPVPPLSPPTLPTSAPSNKSRKRTAVWLSNEHSFGLSFGEKMICLAGCLFLIKFYQKKGGYGGRNYLIFLCWFRNFQNNLRKLSYSKMSLSLLCVSHILCKAVLTLQTWSQRL